MTRMVVKQLEYDDTILQRKVLPDGIPQWMVTISDLPWRLTRGGACHTKVCPRRVFVCLWVCWCVGVQPWESVCAYVCARVCAFSNEGVQNTLCMWGVLKGPKCISFLIVVLLYIWWQLCAGYRRDTSACFTLWHFLPNCFILPSSPSPSVDFRGWRNLLSNNPVLTPSQSTSTANFSMSPPTLFQPGAPCPWRSPLSSNQKPNRKFLSPGSMYLGT